ncbi:MAG: Crp/Fnr family transcriptional regulator [Bacteroidetes bacterium]|jgi:CRP-like cAMP-binding protein|nr:Crp/Fnr family transcriptional regulator [Bacteroidota bacterium]MDF1866150.1 Crp/Fnr family transcriptional regulator [Saprospiraceae bacterium]
MQDVNIDNLVRHFRQKIHLGESEIDELTARVKIKKLRRRQYLLQEGDICRHYNFIQKGCLRMYFVDEKGTENILQFATEDWWISDIGSFHSELPSRLNIDALEATEVLQIKKTDLLFLYENYPQFDRYFRVLTENAFIKMQDRVIQNISSTAEERYLSFLDNYPNLFNRLSQVQIAAFIGVTPEFLSKVRKNLRTK